MSTDGTAINGLFLQSRKFLGEVGKLLMTADEQLSKGEWKPELYKMISTSGKVDRAEDWIPYYATRFYSNTQLPEVIAYVSAVFDFYDDSRVGVPRLNQPMLSYGVMIFATKKDVNWHPWHGAIHFYQKEWRADGKFKDYEPKKTMPTSWCAAVRVSSATLPLISITGPELLGEKCIDPLLEKLAKQVKARK